MNINIKHIYRLYSRQFYIRQVFLPNRFIVMVYDKNEKQSIAIHNKKGKWTNDAW